MSGMRGGVSAAWEQGGGGAAVEGGGGVKGVVLYIILLLSIKVLSCFACNVALKPGFTTETLKV